MLQEGKYPDDNAKRLAIRLLKVFSPHIMKLKDYRFNASDPSELVFRFYLPIIKQDNNLKDNGQILPRLLQLMTEYKATLRIFVDDNRLCVELRVKR